MSCDKESSINTIWDMLHEKGAITPAGDLDLGSIFRKEKPRPAIDPRGREVVVFFKKEKGRSPNRSERRRLARDQGIPWPSMTSTVIGAGERVV